MLRIERVEICGFKSFCDRTEVQFPAGITAVVGPNGCGKSNVGDAINWVLGEQSPKSLRGHQMADVIFNGSQGRKPLGMAEVSLVLAGAEGLPQNDQGRLIFTRRLFRDGESEYLLNGTRSRLKDIQELLRQARVGARTYATIEQGRIDQVLNAKPQERRALIEDAAGVSGYKHKRRLAELKLEATQANLLRVQDVINEVERQVRSLKRQAARARRYRRLREALREAECVRFARRATEVAEELGRLREEEARVRDEEAGTAAHLGRLEVELQQQREALDRTGGARRLLAERQHEVHIGIDRSEGQALGCRERIAACEQSSLKAAHEMEQLAGKLRDGEESRGRQQAALVASQQQLERLMQQLAAKQEEIQAATNAERLLHADGEGLRREQFEAMSRVAELRNRARGILDTLQRISGQGERLRTEQAELLDDRVRSETQAQALAQQAAREQQRLQELRAVRPRTEAALAAARTRLEAALHGLAEGREAEKSAMARLATLEDLETRFAGVSDGVKRLLASGDSAGIRTHGVVADYIEAQQEVEGAAEGYLQWLLPTVILEDDGDARRAVELLRKEGSSRTWLISRTQPAGALAVGSATNGRGNFPIEMLADRRVLGRLRDRLTL
jgi:chromosome segregation protein